MNLTNILVKMYAHPAVLLTFVSLVFSTMLSMLQIFEQSTSEHSESSQRTG